MQTTRLPGGQLKFHALAEYLRRSIDAGTWVVGSKLPTERELAEATGYSINTVRRAVEELVAEGLLEVRQGAGMFVLLKPRSQNREASVGVLLPDLRLYFPKVLEGIKDTLEAADISLVLSTYQYDPGRESEALEQLIRSGVDGLLLVPSEARGRAAGERIASLRKLGKPVVLIERRFEELGSGDPTEFVCSHHTAGAFDAVQHLHALGHTRIALCLREHSRTGLPIRLGYEEAMGILGLDASVVVTATWDEWGPAKAAEVLDTFHQQGVTAALVFGDREAAILEAAALRRGMAVPGELAFVSYDDESAESAPIPLTAVAPSKYRMGRLAAELLLTRLREGNEAPVHQIFLKPRIVIRESCGAENGAGV
ncbi:LacI family transcriptional regulator [Tessaracoccus rhinocerotis]|uniref:LacI family transcriptional regulator n=1 Tax=Tessaracoccus rhinocerotis TaxID=1689449 RepID=A0A553K0J6_9ACTN|nr:LacI family DNA-binding transcriptional regulator [Tessaracoccus rhinocerotis]TRY18234.1 LacI family transcriptional regulator [Tessaracoccus rhinocerotis]